MGHYDDSYAADAEKQQEVHDEANRAAVRKMKKQFTNIEAHIAEMYIDDEQTAHLLQKLRELESLADYYVVRSFL